MNFEVESDGFAIVPRVIAPAERESLLCGLGPVDGAGRRGILAEPEVSLLARNARILDLVRPHLPAEPVAVRAIYFDKSPEANWIVAWHQDLTLALHEQIEVAGFGPWTVKTGIPHVQPPFDFLARMLTVRLHLDDADEANGALRLLPGSHLQGRLSPEDIRALRQQPPRFSVPRAQATFC